MREIKFRAWYTGWSQPRMVEYEVPQPSTRMKLLQYNGLKDKNGKEIFEGAIVENLLPYNDTFLRNIDVTEWNEEICAFELTKRCRSFHDGLILEVIGNIYENPELISKGEKNE